MLPLSPNASPAPTIGWREWLSLPDLAVAGIKAKIDTGARSSALHTSGYEIYEDDAGQKRVRFTLQPLARKKMPTMICDAPVCDVRRVRDSGGHEQDRPFIITTVKIGAHEWPVEFSLTNREGMKFRMLLGRTAVSNRFFVDPARSYIAGPRLSKVYRKSSTSP